ncbi:hypothetical protein E2542_SST22445 [Spatholobus suberectus]|nr:hypothetical protein E2542_SST22445 [Spatholobus suberectus]
MRELHSVVTVTSWTEGASSSPLSVTHTNYLQTNTPSGSIWLSRRLVCDLLSIFLRDGKLTWSKVLSSEPTSIGANSRADGKISLSSSRSVCPWTMANFFYTLENLHNSNLQLFSSITHLFPFWTSH